MIIESLPNKVVLRLGNQTVSAGQEIPWSSVSAGGLTYAPAASEHGDTYTRIHFKLRDYGGKSNNGVDLSDAATITIKVNSVNDAPSFTKGADQTVDQDAPRSEERRVGQDDTYDSSANYR